MDQLSTFNEFYPEASGIILSPSSEFLPPPAYNYSMTMPIESIWEFTVAYKRGKKSSAEIQETSVTKGSKSKLRVCRWFERNLMGGNKNKPTSKTSYKTALLYPFRCCLLQCESQQQ